MLSFSIVINTLNRGEMLRKTLESFRWLRYEGDFEVIVVNGPSSDCTEEVLAVWDPEIRIGKCDAANISVSRNIGICMARGDIVAFIDDDAIPEPEWLSSLAEAYDRPEIGGAGGVVYDHTGYNCQFVYSTADRLGNVNWAAEGNMEHLCFPGSYEFPYLQGTNASFRRAALLEIGGFDEEFEYYLDETEVCCRLIDAGYVIRQLENAWVHHKIAASALRDSLRITRDRYPSLKNKLYFSLKHAFPSFSLEEILRDGEKFIEESAEDMEQHIKGGRIPPSVRERFFEDAERARKDGLERGLSDSRELITPAKLEKYQCSFRKFQASAGEKSRAVVFVSRDLPAPLGENGDRLILDAAKALASRGNIVHVITGSTDINRVDFEHGIWVHRILPLRAGKSPEAGKRRLPARIWAWSAAALEETRRIAAHRDLWVVEAPVHDCQGAAFLFDRQWPLVSFWAETLHARFVSGQEIGRDGNWIQSFAVPVLAMEKELVARSDAVRSIGNPEREDDAISSGFIFDKERFYVTHQDPGRLIQERIELYGIAREHFRKRIEGLSSRIRE